MLSASLVAVAAFILIIARLVWQKAPDRELAWRFSLSTSLFALWALALAGVYEGFQFAGGVAFASTAMGIAFFISFTSFYPIDVRRNNAPRRTVERIVVGIGALFAILALFTNLIVYDTTLSDGRLSRSEGPFYPFFAIFLITGSCIAVGTLAYKLTHARGLARARLQHLVLGVLLAVAGGLSANILFPLLTGLSTYSWLGPLFTLCYVALVAHGIIRHRLMDLRLVVHRGLSIAIATTLSLVPIGLLLLAVWPRLLIDLDGTELALLLSAVVVATLLVPPTRDLAVTILDRYIYRTQANYRRTVTSASQMLTRVLDLKALLSFISTTVMKSTGAEGVVIYLRDGSGFRLAAAEKAPAIEHFVAPDGVPNEMLAGLEKMREPLITEEASAMVNQPGTLHDTLDQLNWALLLPVQADGRLIGLIALGPKLSGDPYYPQDLDLLMTLSNQAGIAVKNAQLYAQVLLANEYIVNIVSTIESGVVAIDGAGRITMFNRAAEALTGRSARNVLDQMPSDALPKELAEALVTTFTGGGSKTIPEIELLGPRTNTQVICTTSAMLDPKGAVLGAVAVLSDLTPVRELERVRRRAERLTYFELLASGIAHEIKNPLVSIKTFTQLLPRRMQDNRFVEEFGRIADREIARMEQLLERLRHLSKPHDRFHKPIDVREPIQDALDSLRAAFDSRELTVTSSLGEEQRIIVGDHNDLESLFLNLLINAQESTPPGGSVAVELNSDEGMIAITVSDTGPGIPVDSLEHIFDPFVTTKTRGSGLGLALCAGIAQGHGARITAANRTGGGAVFTVEFPLASKVTSPVLR